MRLLIPLVIIYFLLVWLAARSVYYPMRYPDGDWSAGARLGAEDVFIDTADGVKLHAWLVRSPEARWVTLHLHGNAGNLTYRTAAARDILEAGSSVLLLDYRGYGKSDGRPWERGLYHDGEAAYEYLKHMGYTPDRIVVHGESLGTAVAVELASRHPCAGVVLEAPFSSARAVARRVLPLLGPLLTWGFNTKSKVAKVHVPVLVIQGDRDEVIPPDLGRAVYESANQPKDLWILPGAGHNDLHENRGGEFHRRLADFYSRLGK